MVFKNYSYGSRRKDVKKLLCKRLQIRSKIRYHENKAEEFKNIKLPAIEKEIDILLERIKKKE
jgi:hypothetical protein